MENGVGAVLDGRLMVPPGGRGGEKGDVLRDKGGGRGGKGGLYVDRTNLVG